MFGILGIAVAQQRAAREWAEKERGKEISLALSMLESETGCEAYYTGRWTSNGPVVGYWGKTSIPPIAKKR